MKKQAINLEEFARLAFYKWQLSGKRSMNTFLFSILKKYNLTDKQFQTIIDMTQMKIDNYEREKEKELMNDIENELNTIEIYGDVY